MFSSEMNSKRGHAIFAKNLFLGSLEIDIELEIQFGYSENTAMLQPFW